MVENDELNDFTEKVKTGLELSYQKWVAFKKMHNSPLIVWEDGEVVAIPPDEIPPTRKEANQPA